MVSDLPECDFFQRFDGVSPEDAGLIIAEAVGSRKRKLSGC